MTMTATYSPEDNKLRLYSLGRLDDEDLARVKGAGFRWAPRQELWVAPAWSPTRADLLIDLCGEIEDEDKSLVERAEERAERFEGYQDSRSRDAAAAYASVEAVSKRFEMGQPIILNHHSTKRALRDKERMEDGMRRAVQMWDTAQYWQDRAAGALRHAKYKERPDVRYRRIKGLQSDERKQQAIVDRARKLIALWTDDTHELTRAHAIQIAGIDGGYWEWSYTYPFNYTGPISLWEALQEDREERNGLLISPEQARDKAVQNHQRAIAYAERWLAHLAHRLTYERAMLGESGGLGVDRADIPVQVGGRVLVGRTGWATVLKLNRKDGALVSVSVNGRWGRRVVGIEEIGQVEAPDPTVVKAVKAALTKPPLCNYAGEGFTTMTRAEWDRLWKDSKGTLRVAATETHAEHRVRCQYRYRAGEPRHLKVFVSDMPQKDAPPVSDEPVSEASRVPAPTPDIEVETARAAAITAARAEGEAKAVKAAPYEQLREALRTGIEVRTVPDLFPTPEWLADRVVEEANIQPGDRVLEPNAGTGALLDAIKRCRGHLDLTYAVEINRDLCDALRARYDIPVCGTDFLTYEGMNFERVIMNPPFSNGVDVKHVLHAYKLLKPGGRVVAIVAGGTRQQASLGTMASECGSWEDLPPGTFAAERTNANCALVILDKPVAAAGC